MAKQEKIVLRNNRNRNYNGIRFGGTVEVKTSESYAYLSAGFVEVATISDESEADAKAAAAKEKADAEALAKQEADAKAAAEQK